MPRTIQMKKSVSSYNTITLVQNSSINSLTRLGSTEIRVQTYGAKSKKHNVASRLVFDEHGVVTVLCFASAKGLEFDAVFLPELQSHRR